MYLAAWHRCGLDVKYSRYLRVSVDAGRGFAALGNLAR
jgi:hypothetical protein